MAGNLPGTLLSHGDDSLEIFLVWIAWAWNVVRHHEREVVVDSNARLTWRREAAPGLRAGLCDLAHALLVGQNAFDTRLPEFLSGGTDVGFSC